MTTASHGGLLGPSWTGDGPEAGPFTGTTQYAGFGQYSLCEVEGEHLPVESQAGLIVRPHKLTLQDSLSPSKGSSVSIYNYLHVEARCPWCQVDSLVDAEFRFGLRDLIRYRLGDTIRWEGRGVRTPAHRPPEGNYVGEAYAECPSCGKDYWLDVHVRNDVIAEVEVHAHRVVGHTKD